MEKKVFFLLLLAGFALTGCQKEVNKHEAQIKTYESLLAAKYPNASGFEWSEKTVSDNVYDMATFTYSSNSRATYNAEAWFDRAKGKWRMTEIEITFDELPDAVKQAFQNSEYADWRIEEVEKIEREGLEIKYEIEVKKQGTEADLYYAPDGTLLDVILDNPGHNNNGSLPSPIVDDIIAFINSHYSGANLIDLDIKHHFIKVKIIHENRKKQVRFDLQGNWLFTKYEVALAEVPQPVVNAFNGSEYANYEIDEIEFYETPQETYYVFELEAGDEDIEIKITPDGVLSVIGNGNGGGNGGGNGHVVGELDPVILDFINTNYPSAEVLSTNFPNTKIKVKIRHEGLVKNVFFERQTLAWIKTCWMVEWNHVPQAVHDAVAASPYAQYEVEEVHYVETPEQVFYAIELEADGQPDVTLHITPEGVIL